MNRIVMTDKEIKEKVLGTLIHLSCLIHQDDTSNLTEFQIKEIDDCCKWLREVKQELNMRINGTTND